MRRPRKQRRRYEAAPRDLSAIEARLATDQQVDAWVESEPGNGNREFFNLGLSLAYAGVPDHEFELKVLCQTNGPFLRANSSGGRSRSN